MTKQEGTNRRPSFLSGWMREKLPDSQTGFTVMDIDWFIQNWKTKRCIILEEKTGNASLSYAQKKAYENLDKWIRKGIDPEWIYYGWHVVRIADASFADGTIWFDDKPITEDALIDKLSLNRGLV